MTPFEFKYDDGGRAEAGFEGYTGDCVARAIAILTGKRYCAVYERLNVLTHYAKGYRRAYAHDGIALGIYRAYLLFRGWRYVDLDRKSRKPKYLCVEDMPKVGRFLARVEMGKGDKHHVVAVINGVVHDNSRKAKKPRRVLGYFVRKRRRRQKGRN